MRLEKQRYMLKNVGVKFISVKTCKGYKGRFDEVTFHI